MPGKGNSSGIVFNISQEPSGLKGASMLSHKRHKKIKAIKLQLAPSLNEGNL
jgi:hypothetical protein